MRKPPEEDSFGMKKLTALFLSLLLVLSAMPALATGGYANRLEKVLGEGKLVMATSPDYAPFEFINPLETGQAAYAGADITLAQYLAERLGVELVIEAMSFEEMIAAVGAGKVDLALAGMSANEERRTTLDFTNSYSHDVNQVILIRAEDAGALGALAAFAGRSVAAQQGAVQMELVTTQLLGAKAAPVAATSTGVAMLLNGMVDGVVLGAMAAGRYVANYPELAICAERLDYQMQGAVGAVPKGEAELLDRLNEVFDDVLAQGLYEDWFEDATALVNAINELYTLMEEEEAAQPE